MNILRFFLRLAGWLVTIVLQVSASFLIIFLFTVIFAGVDSKSRLGWLALLFVIWLSYAIGINFIGQAAIRLIWKDVRPLWRPRLISTAVGALLPLLILLVIGYSVPVGDEGTRFYNLVTSRWQPILAQASLFTAILGFYIPGIIKLKS